MSTTDEGCKSCGISTHQIPSPAAVRAAGRQHCARCNGNGCARCADRTGLACPTGACPVSEGSRTPPMRPAEPVPTKVEGVRMPAPPPRDGSTKMEPRRPQPPPVVEQGGGKGGGSQGGGSQGGGSQGGGSQGGQARTPQGPMEEAPRILLPRPPVVLKPTVPIKDVIQLGGNGGAGGGKGGTVMQGGGGSTLTPPRKPAQPLPNDGNVIAPTGGGTLDPTLGGNASRPSKGGNPNDRRPGESLEDYCKRFPENELCPQQPGPAPAPVELTTFCANVLQRDFGGDLSKAVATPSGDAELCQTEFAAAYAAQRARPAGAPIAVWGAPIRVRPSGAPIAVPTITSRRGEPFSADEINAAVRTFLALGPSEQAGAMTYGFLGNQGAAGMFARDTLNGVVGAPVAFLQWLKGNFTNTSPEVQAFAAALYAYAVQAQRPAGDVMAQSLSPIVDFATAMALFKRLTPDAQIEVLRGIAFPTNSYGRVLANTLATGDLAIDGLPVGDVLEGWFEAIIPPNGGERVLFAYDTQRVAERQGLLTRPSGDVTVDACVVRGWEALGGRSIKAQLAALDQLASAFGGPTSRWARARAELAAWAPGAVGVQYLFDIVGRPSSWNPSEVAVFCQLSGAPAPSSAAKAAQSALSATQGAQDARSVKLRNPLALGLFRPAGDIDPTQADIDARLRGAFGAGSGSTGSAGTSPVPGFTAQQWASLTSSNPEMAARLLSEAQNRPSTFQQVSTAILQAGQAALNAVNQSEQADLARTRLQLEQDRALAQARLASEQVSAQNALAVAQQQLAAVNAQANSSAANLAAQLAAQQQPQTSTWSGLEVAGAVAGGAAALGVLALAIKSFMEKRESARDGARGGGYSRAA